MSDDKLVFNLKSPMTLRNLCIERVARMAMQFKANAEEEARSAASFEENHFIDVPSIFIEEILGKIGSSARKEARKSWIDIFRVLLIKPIERFEFDFTSLALNDLHEVLGMLTHTNSQLKVLKLTDDSYMHKSVTPFYKALITTMPSLTHLEITGVSCDDALLETVGDCCPHLAFLSLSILPWPWHRYSSAGLQRLCTNEDGTVKRCQKLHTVKLSELHSSDVTDGIVALLLGLPELSVLECKHKQIVKAFRQLDHQTQLKIRAIRYDNDFSQSCSLVVLAQMCPNLEELTLNLPISVTETLRRCPPMPTLKKLTFCNSDWNILVLFLENNGKSIRALTIEDADNVSCTAIDDLCPNLEEVTFRNVRTADEVLSPTPLFANVETLKLYDFRDASPTGVPKWLSNVHNVRHLEVYDETLKKGDFQDIVSCNRFEHLVSVRVGSKYLSIVGETSGSGTPLSDILRTRV